MSQRPTFRFAPGAHGQPEVRYVVDLMCECGVCGQDASRHHSETTLFHPLTLDGLRELAEDACELAGFGCEECSERVGPANVVRAVVTYGFPDDAGQIRIFVDGPFGERRFRYELIEQDGRESNALPRWKPDDERGEVLDAIDEYDIEDIYGRVFSPKVLWGEIFSDWLKDPDGGAFARMSPACWLVIDESEQMASELVEDIEDVEFDDQFIDGNLWVVPLLDSTPTGLATHDHPEHLPGRWRTWLPEPAQRALDDGTAWAEVYVVAREVVEAMARTLDASDLTYRVESTEADAYFFEITAPGDVVYGRGVSVSSVVRRAVFTGITPGESARLTAEEIAGMLLGVWRETGHE
jgi:hypothetical protein